MGIKSISMTVEARYTTRPSEEERAVRIKSISIAAETYCTTKTLTASRRRKIHKRRREQKQNDKHKELQQIQTTSWNKHHGRAITNTNRGRATPKQDSCGYTKLTIYNGNSQADSNLEHPKPRQRISRQTYWKPFTMAKPNNIRDQHPDEEL